MRLVARITASAAAAATTATATTTSAAAAATAVATSATTATATGTFFARPSFIDGQIATVDVFAMQGLDSLVGIFFGFHGHEREAARASAHFVHDQIDVSDRAMCCKQVLQIIFSGVEGKISHKQFSIHF